MMKRFRLAAAVVLLALAATGCRHVMVNGELPAGNTKIAVMDFEPVCSTAMRDYVIMGRAGVNRPGPLAARFFRRTLAKSPRVRVLHWRGMERRLKGNVPVPSADPKVAAPTAKVLANELDVDYVVIGELCEYHTAWFLVIQWVRVHFKITGYDGKTGEEVFWAEADDVDMWGVEEDLMLRLSKELISALGTPPSQRKK